MGYSFRCSSVKRVATVLALVVVEIGLIDLLADTTTDFVAYRATDQTTNECAEQ